jgi:4-amino-4-deoxy-L-arabinose transferase-like glycosyltransferase
MAFALGYWTGQPLTKDEREYLSLARSITVGRGVVYGDEVSAIDPVDRAPGYPLFLALAGGGRAVPQSVPASVKIAQSFVGALGVLLVASLASRLAGPGVAWPAALIAACYPPLVWVAAYGWSEAIFWPLGLAVACLFDRALDADGRTALIRAIVCGVVAGAAVLVRPGTLFFFLIAGLWLIRRRRPSLAAALILGGAIVIGPWTLRNYTQSGRLVLVASEGGVTFWTGNNAHARGEGDLAANPELKDDRALLQAEHPGLNEAQMEAVYYKEAFGWIRMNSARWLLLEGRKLFYLIVPIGPSYLLHSTRYLVASVVSYMLLLPLAILGAVRLGLRRRRSPGLWILAASAVALCLVFFPQERFRIPIIDPVLIVCASALLSDEPRTPGRPPRIPDRR